MIIPKKTFSNFTPADFLNPNKPIEEIEPVADPEHHFKVWGVAPKIFQIVNPFFLLILPKIFKNFSFWEGECKNFSIYDFFLLPHQEIQWVIPFSHFFPLGEEVKIPPWNRYWIVLEAFNRIESNLQSLICDILIRLGECEGKLDIEHTNLDPALIRLDIFWSLIRGTKYDMSHS